MEPQTFDDQVILLKKVSTITEERSCEDVLLRQKEEMESISATQGEENFEQLHEPSETQVGSFRVRIEPNCGMEVAGC